MKRQRLSYDPDALPPTVGWNKLMAWLGKPGNTVSLLARIAQVSQPSAHAWRWRDKRPVGEHLKKICQIIGAEPEEFEKEVPTPRKRRKAA